MRLLVARWFSTCLRAEIPRPVEAEFAFVVWRSQMNGLRWGCIVCYTEFALLCYLPRCI